MIQKTKKRISLIGTGGRSGTYLNPIYSTYSEDCELVSICDSSRFRMKHRLQEIIQDKNTPPVPMYHSDDFEKMIEETHPDEIIICTVDATHHEYIDKALRAGCDVVTEKPMTTDHEKCRFILKAVKDSGKKVRVTFNYRWIPANTKIREIIQSGTIGNVKHVHMEYALNTSHGADYFRRWHSDKALSGGLLVHKSTHHFDLINWWTNAIPKSVYAVGNLVFYGKGNAMQRGDEKYTPYDRYTGTDSHHDPFRLDLRDKTLYYGAEEETGYIRDKNVFRDGIDIEDSMSTIVQYRNGMVLNYSLNAFSPKEGMRVVFHGDRGRLEFAQFGGSHLILGQSDEKLEEEQNKDKGIEELILTPHFNPSQHLEIPKDNGAHGGGDKKLLEQIYSQSAPNDPFHRSAGHEQGTASIMVGIAANESMNTGYPVEISNLIPEFNTVTTKLDDLI